jgi:hypothetical protein
VVSSSARFATLVVGRVRLQGRRVDGRWVAEADLPEAYELNAEKDMARQAKHLEATHRAGQEAYLRSLNFVRGDRAQQRRGWHVIATAPDGTTFSAADQDTVLHDARLYWDQQPPAATPQRLSYQQWLGDQLNDPRRDWQAELVHGDGQCEPQNLGESSSSWWGAPLVGIAALLDDLTSQGWQLLHVSEDRGLYSGADVGEESYPTRQRYLLKR